MIFVSLKLWICRNSGKRFCAQLRMKPGFKSFTSFDENELFSNKPAIDLQIIFSGTCETNIDVDQVEFFTDTCAGPGALRTTYWTAKCCSTDGENCTEIMRNQTSILEDSTGEMSNEIGFIKYLMMYWQPVAPFFLKPVPVDIQLECGDSVAPLNMEQVEVGDVCGTVTTSHFDTVTTVECGEVFWFYLRKRESYWDRLG